MMANLFFMTSSNAVILPVKPVGILRPLLSMFPSKSLVSKLQARSFRIRTYIFLIGSVRRWPGVISMLAPIAIYVGPMDRVAKYVLLDLYEVFKGTEDPKKIAKWKSNNCGVKRNAVSCINKGDITT